MSLPRRLRLSFVSLRSLSRHVAGVDRPRGGAESQVATLAESMAARGHDVSIILADYCGAMLSRPRRLTVQRITAPAPPLPAQSTASARWTSGAWRRCAVSLIITALIVGPSTLTMLRRL